MKTKLILATTILALIAAPLFAQQVPIPQKAADITPAYWG